MSISAPDLAAQLGIDAKNLRKWLRGRYGHSENPRWVLNDRQVVEVKLALQHGLISRVLSTSQGEKLSLGSPKGLPGYAYRAFNKLELETALRCKTSPEVVRVQVGKTTISLYPILHVNTRSGRRSIHRVAITGDGMFLSTAGDHEGFIKISSGDYLDTQYLYYPHHQSGEPERMKYSFYHRDYVAGLQKLEIPLHLVEAVLPSTAAKLDTPQYLVLNWYNRQFLKALYIRNIFVESIKLGKPVDGFTLRDLWNIIPTERITRQTAWSYHSEDSKISLGPITSYLSTINLLKITPPEGPEFQVTLKDIYRRFAFEPGQKALQLREEVAQKFGFKKNNEGSWVKGESWGSMKVEITPDLGVFIGGSYTCIVSAITVDLPFEDEVVRRMLCVATKYREKIYTITPTKRTLLEELFPESEYKPD